jgi:hypothetical protein
MLIVAIVVIALVAAHLAGGARSHRRHYQQHGMHRISTTRTAAAGTARCACQADSGSGTDSDRHARQPGNVTQMQSRWHPAVTGESNNAVRALIPPPGTDGNCFRSTCVPQASHLDRRGSSDTGCYRVRGYLYAHGLSARHGSRSQAVTRDSTRRKPGLDSVVWSVSSSG